MTRPRPRQSPRDAAGNAGVCHLCQDWKPVTWCNACRHFFCEDCKRKVFRRGFEAVMELVAIVTGRLRRLDRPCCGPDAGEKVKDQR